MADYSNAQKQKLEEDELGKKIDELEQDKLPPANIVVAGITGTGKSTLINAIFGADLAATGKGMPVTEQINEYQNTDIPIHIWDTVGLEIDSDKTKKSINSIRQTIADKAGLTDQFDRVHAIWYCINSGSNRYQGAELEFIKNLHSIGVPFIIVLTQCIGDQEEINQFENQIHEMNKTMGMSDIDVVQVCAMPFKLRGFTIDAFGLDTLVDKTLEKLPDFIKSGFIAAQRVSKVQKRSLCEDEIFTFVYMARDGFWDKIPFINIFTANSKISKMFVRIGEIYNTVLPKQNIERIIDQLGSIDFKNGFFGLISPFNKKYNKKIDKLLEEKKEEGFDVEVQKVDKSQRVVRLIAYYGYSFLDAVEEVWEDLTEEELKKTDYVVEKLREKLNEILQSRK